MLSTGDELLGIAIRPIAAMTAENASSSGTPAATSDPKAITRISRVIGSESSSALPRSLWKVSFSSLFELTLPNCSTRKSGLVAATPSMTSCEGSIRSRASRSSPVISNSTSAECPSADTGASPVNGELTFSTFSVRPSRSDSCSTTV